MSKSSATSTTSCPPLKPDDYSHSPVHYAVVLADHTTLSRIVAALPRLADPTQIHTESDSSLMNEPPTRSRPYSTAATSPTEKRPSTSLSD
ncbi:ankyrin repeat domain-containing protein 13C [Prunus yedoensis var. nudiflora]|uniref:Ankyrin repeat domain-containing protein 13C n=1 Tax=Prunus yedoensis var. nudiflora TaxID=2094558 RepID=A0A314ZJT7_PRUYE|nr:ankyrin repeat domain-containing protein 13C [Prunus yedoensis var. nudiflora]